MAKGNRVAGGDVLTVARLGGYYENGSLIWRSRWVGDGRIECREALAMPADPRRAVLLRRIEALDGAARVSVLLDLRAGYSP